MAIDLTFFRDAAGTRCARVPQGHIRLAQFLECELQGSKALCQEVLRAADAVASGASSSWSETGNVLSLELTPRGARFASELEDDPAPADVPLADFREAVARWLTFLETP